MGCGAVSKSPTPTPDKVLEHDDTIMLNNRRVSRASLIKRPSKLNATDLLPITIKSSRVIKKTNLKGNNLPAKTPVYK